METVVLRDSITGAMTDDYFFQFCIENSRLRIERNNELNITISSGASTAESVFRSEVLGQLCQWNRANGNGVVFDSSAGFTLHDRSVFSPDAAWVSKVSWMNLSNEDKNKFAPLCPEFVIEIRSKSDNLEDLRKKVEVWISNKTQLAWLIDPIDKICYVYHSDRSTETYRGFDVKLKGDGPVKGFELDLPSINSQQNCKLHRETLTTSTRACSVRVNELKSFSIQSIRKI